jgi:two-component system OmpR family response regulator
MFVEYTCVHGDVTVRILLIEDDHRLSTLIAKTLTIEGFQVDAAYNGEEGVEIALRGAHDIAIVDWMLPGRDGPSVCQAIRNARLSMGLLMLTARSQVEDRVAGLYSGADDYLTKPFAFDELIARLHALSRRNNAKSFDLFELRAGNLVFDTRAHTARRGEVPLDLTKTEWTLLECFLRHPGQTLSRQFLLDYVWSYAADVQPSMVDVYVSYLRSKLRQPGKKDPIVTQRGFGYRLEQANA